MLLCTLCGLTQASAPLCLLVDLIRLLIGSVPGHQPPVCYAVTVPMQVRKSGQPAPEPVISIRKISDIAEEQQTAVAGNKAAPTPAQQQQSAVGFKVVQPSGGLPLRKEVRSHECLAPCTGLNLAPCGPCDQSIFHGSVSLVVPVCSQARYAMVLPGCSIADGSACVPACTCRRMTRLLLALWQLLLRSHKRRRRMGGRLPLMLRRGMW
jgi:hypothetical protein